MRIIATCMLGNEADIVEAFVRHHAEFLDAVVVLDHVSVDATPQILASLAHESLPLVLLRDSDRAFRQGERQTALVKRYIEELRADYCFALDADEFIKVPTRAALESALSALPPGAHGLVALQNYFGAGEAGEGETNPVRRLTRRMARERALARKVVLHRGFAAERAGQISLGNHAAVRATQGRAEPLAHAPLGGVFLAHFPVRSPEQVARKALLGWLSHRLTIPERFLGADAAGTNVPASHWRDIFAGLASGALKIDERLAQEAIVAYAGGGGPVTREELVEDALPAPYALRYTPASPAPALAALAAWADQLVTDLNAGRIAAMPQRRGAR